MFKINKDTRIIRKFDYDKEYFPKVGMLGTEYVGSDRYGVICLQVNSPKKIVIGRLFNLNEDNVKNNKDIRIDDEGVSWMDTDSKTLEKYGIHGARDMEFWSLRTNKRTGNTSWHEQGKSKRSSSIHWGIASPHIDIDR